MWLKALYETWWSWGTNKQWTVSCVSLLLFIKINKKNRQRFLSVSVVFYCSLSRLGQNTKWSNTEQLILNILTARNCSRLTLTISALHSAYEFREWLKVRCSEEELVDRKSTRLNSSHANISYAVFCLKKKKTTTTTTITITI